MTQRPFHHCTALIKPSSSSSSSQPPAACLLWAPKAVWPNLQSHAYVRMVKRTPVSEAHTEPCYPARRQWLPEYQYRVCLRDADSTCLGTALWAREVGQAQTAGTRISEAQLTMSGNLVFKASGVEMPNWRRPEEGCQTQPKMLALFVLKPYTSNKLQIGLLGESCLHLHGLCQTSLSDKQDLQRRLWKSIHSFWEETSDRNRTCN